MAAGMVDRCMQWVHVTLVAVPFHSSVQSLSETELITQGIIYTQCGQPQPEPAVAVTVGQDTLSKVEGITYSAAVQVIVLCLW